MARVQLALNVSDLDQAVHFYSALFGAVPAKVQPGYANFAIADPPLKLVLIESTDQREPGVRGALSHLGVEVDTAAEVSEASRRFDAEGLEPADQHATTCCYAVQDKVWVRDPDGASWEIYTVLADAPVESGLAGDGTCCGEPTSATAKAATATGHSCCRTP